MEFPASNGLPGHQGPPQDDDDYSSDLFKSDEFRLWCMKVIPCTKRFVHDWTICPFAHAGEKAVRRDPRLHNYTGIACPDMKKTGSCIRGEKCPYAHNVFEYWLHPTRYRTQLCNDGPMCRRGICFFAHSLEELRVPACKPYVSPEALARASLEAIQQNPHPLGQQLPNPVAAAQQQAAMAAMGGRGPHHGSAPHHGGGMRGPHPRDPHSSLAPSAMPFVPGSAGAGGGGGSFRPSGEPVRYSAPGAVPLLGGSPGGSDYGSVGAGNYGHHSMGASGRQGSYGGHPGMQQQAGTYQQQQQQRWAQQQQQAQGAYGSMPAGGSGHRGPPSRVHDMGAGSAPADAGMRMAAAAARHRDGGGSGGYYPSAPARVPSPVGGHHSNFSSFAAVQHPPAQGFAGPAPAPAQPFGSYQTVDASQPSLGAPGGSGSAPSSHGSDAGSEAPRPSTAGPAAAPASGRDSPAVTDDLAQSLASLKIALTQQQLAAAAGSNHEVVISTLHQILKDAMAQQGGSFGAAPAAAGAADGGPAAAALYAAQQGLACGDAGGWGSPNGAAGASFGSAPSTISSSLAGSMPIGNLPLSGGRSSSGDAATAAAAPGSGSKGARPAATSRHLSKPSTAALPRPATQSEYPPDCDARRAFISGFDGSAGTAVVTTDAALLWTDGRYFLQAEQQLGPDWTLMRDSTPGVPPLPDWLAESLPAGARVGIDPWVHTVEAAEKLRRRLKASGKSLVALESNLVDGVWGSARPAPPSAPLRVHALEWAGQTVADKLAVLRRQMAEEGAGALLVTMLDEVAWLFNLRGGDVAYNPVFVSYGVVTAEGATLYVDTNKVTPEVAAHLGEAGVEVKEYGALLGDVQAMAAAGTKIWMDPSRVSYALKQAALQAAAGAAAKAPAAGSRKRARGANGSPAAAAAAEESGSDGGAPADVLLEKPSPVTLAKSVKNAAELAGMREAHLRDGVALVCFLCWLEKTIASGKTLTEVEIDEHLTARRAAQPGFIEPSFPTIAGAGPNGAIIHYRAQPGTCRTVDGNTLLLLDSGAQFDCGTTDITRTMHFGSPSAHQKTCFTAVLQGHIGLDTAVWPEGTPGCALDTLARTPLWALGLNYRHGTGHGVGAALNVHEGPQSISTRYWVTQPLLEHMVCSNEPGYYEDGAFGIRIENLFTVVEADTEFRYGGLSYLTCERLTLCPIQKKMIAKELLSQKEVAWVNAYHQQVWEALSPRLAGEEEELAWLKEATAPL